MLTYVFDQESLGRPMPVERSGLAPQTPLHRLGAGGLWWQEVGALHVQADKKLLKKGRECPHKSSAQSSAVMEPSRGRLA